MSAKERMLKLLQENLDKVVSRNDLSNVAKVHDWQRSIRTLREEGWEIDSLKEGYILKNLSKKATVNSRKSINNRIRYEVLQRDNSTCQRCGNTIKDGIKLEVDHKIPVNWGGTNEIQNLWTLCNECNGGKKNLYADFDEEIMKEVFKEENGYKKIKKLFELIPNMIIEPSLLSAVSGIRDWTRTIRLIRDKEKMNIAWIPENKQNPRGGYMYESKK